MLGARVSMPLVSVLALGAALCSAAATILIRQGLRGSDPYTGFSINLMVGTVALWAAVLLTGDLRRVSWQGAALFALAGVIGTVAGRLLRFVSIDRVGASVAAAVINLNPLFASALAVLTLGERVTPPIAVGTLVIVGGTVLLSTSGERLGFRPAQLALPLLSAACFGSVAVLRKVGQGQTTGAVVGTAINVTTALVVFAGLLRASGAVPAGRCPRRSLGYFVAAGLAENGGVLLNVLAIGLGTVSVATPLSASAPIFVLALSALFLRGVEAVTARVVAGTVLIVAGVYLLTALAGR